MEKIHNLEKKTLLENDVNDPQVSYCSSHNHEASIGERAIVEFTDNDDMDSYIDNFLAEEGLYCIKYFYNSATAKIFIKRQSGNIDGKRAALYCEFMCEKWFGEDKMLTNLGVASLLVSFYGFQEHAAGPCEIIDMYLERSAFAGEEAQELMDDQSLYREKLREFMEPHVVT